MMYYFYHLAIHMQLAHRYIRYALLALSVFRNIHVATSKHKMTPERATSNTKVLHPHLIVYTRCYRGENVN